MLFGKEKLNRWYGKASLNIFMEHLTLLNIFVTVNTFSNTGIYSFTFLTGCIFHIQEGKREANERTAATDNVFHGWSTTFSVTIKCEKKTKFFFH